MRIHTQLSLALLLTATAASQRTAEACTPPSTAKVHRYWNQLIITGGQPTNPDRCTYSWFSGWQCHLSGWLYTPTGAGNTNLPLVMYIHGSGGDWGSGGAKSKKGGCELVNQLVSEGYVVWAPFMRGVGDDSDGTTPSIFTSTTAGFANTGTYVVDWAEEQSDPSSPNYGWFTAAMPGWGVTSPTEKDYEALTTLTYMNSQVDDVQAALTYVTGLPGLAGTGKLVDPAKVALTGHSYGGLTVDLATSRTLTPSPKAVVSMSAGTLSWGSSIIWENVIKYYVAKHKQPVMAIQLNEEASTGFAPVQAIYNAAISAGPSGNRIAKFFADAALNALCATDPEIRQCYHNEFFGDPDWVDQWAPGMLDFLEDNVL